MKPRLPASNRLQAPQVITTIYLFIGFFWTCITLPFFRQLVQHTYLFYGIRVLQVSLTAFILYSILRYWQSALTKSQQEYRDLVELGREPILIHAAGKIIDINEYGVQLLEAMNKEALLGKNVLDIAHPSDRETAARRIQQLQRGISTDITEMKVLTLKGNVKYVEIVGFPVETGDSPVVKTMLRDITQRKEAERKLYEVANLFHRIEENMTDAIAILDLSGGIQYISPSHVQILGRETTFDKSQFIKELVHSEDRDRVRTEVLHMMQSRQPLRLEFRVLGGSGEWLYIEMHGNVILGAGDEVAGCILVSRNVTERKITEDLLRRSDKLSVVGELAAGLAHEVRNPLTVIQGFIQLLKTAEKPNIDHVSIMLSELQRVESIIEEFLVFAKPTAAKFKDTDICRTLEYTIALLETQAIMKSIQIESDFQMSSAVIRCNEGHLKQAFLNVIKNAIDAMQNAGTIVVRVKTQCNKVSVIVKDQGCGIPEHLIQRLGEPFFTTKENGTGLGLLVTHNIVESNGGKIQFRSVPAEGTEVEFTFPLWEQPIGCQTIP